MLGVPIFTPTQVSKYRFSVCSLFKDFVNCFTLSYHRQYPTLRTILVGGYRSGAHIDEKSYLLVSCSALVSLSLGGYLIIKKIVLYVLMINSPGRGKFIRHCLTTTLESILTY